MRSVTPSRIRGTVAAPPSKSMTVRALAAALLADGVSTIRNVSSCDDGLATVAIIGALGAGLDRRGDAYVIRGTGKPSAAATPGTRLDCAESGLAMRMFAPIVALMDRTTVLAASGSLQSRPMEMVGAMEQLGASIRTEGGHAPLTIRGPLKGGSIAIDASVSSQFLTGLLMALPLADADSFVSARGLKSVPYVRMTLRLLKDFGVFITADCSRIPGCLEEFTIPGRQRYCPSDYTIEGDWSGAAFLLVAGAIGGSVTVTGLDTDSFQADRAIMAALEDVGAAVLIGKGSVTVQRCDLKAFEFDATSCPDLFPPLVALASNCAGKTLLHGVDRLAHKESDRARALVREFEKLGVMIETVGNTLEVSGGPIRGGEVDSHNDHRIAMAAAVAALRADSTVSINRDEAVSKSYPDFFADLTTLQVTE